jgi:hypothetical protein
MRPLAGVVVALVLAAPAHAATWSKPRAYDRATCRPASMCVAEPAPRVAVNARGVAAAAWVDTHSRARVAVADEPGRFGAAHTLATRALRPVVAVAPDGTVTAVWERGGTLRFARRAGGRFGRQARLAPRGSKRGDASAHVAAQPDGSVVVAYESGDSVRAVTLSPAGRPGAPVTLGKGEFGRDSVRAAPDGTLTACCLVPVNNDPSVPQDTALKVLVYRGGWRIVSAAAVGKELVSHCTSLG